MPVPVPIAVGLELARALGGVALAPARAALYLARRPRWEAEVQSDLARPVPELERTSLPPCAPSAATEAPLRIFLSCAEHSGELHGANLIDALTAECAARGLAPPEVHGLGGPALTERGMHAIANPGARAAMGFDGVVKALPYYLRLLTDTTRHIRKWRPDVVVPVDSPALHVPLARLAHGGRRRPAIVHFVTPQYWGWAPWRVRGYRRVVDLGLSILPFEAPWFERHGVRVQHIGHPLLDELASAGAEHRSAAPASGPLILLPGSREGVVRKNLPWMLERVAALQARPELDGLEVILPHSRTDLDPVFDELLAASPARVERVRGPLHEELARGSAAFVVSGTVVLDLLPHKLPAVVVYTLKSKLQRWMGDRLLSVPWFTSVNLLANREVHPEFAIFEGQPQAPVEDALARALLSTEWRAANLAGQLEAERRLGPPGAVARAAAAIVDQALAARGLAPGGAA